MIRFTRTGTRFIVLAAALLFGAGALLAASSRALAQATVDTVWVEDALPAGATPVPDIDGWNWVSSNPAPYAGTLAHQSVVAAGVHQHYFTGATATLPVKVGDTLFTYVYLDPVNPPSEVMLQWNDDSALTWNHRAYWGANLIPYGVDGTVSRRYMGPLPPTGQWVRLSVPAEQVGLEGTTLSGASFVQYNGRATWDHSGKTSATQLRLSGSVTNASAAVGGVAITGTGSAACSPSDAAGAYVCSVPYGWSGTITPQLNGYSFVPPSRSYTNVTSGIVADNYTLAAAIDISPKAVALAPLSSSQFTASVINSAASVVWSVDAIVGGNASVGTITPTGLYVAPAATGSHSITAALQGTGIAGSASVGVNNYRGVFTFHNDVARTGANAGEVVLAPANVTAAQFGKLFSFPVDGEIYAQPLYVANVAIPGQGMRNVVYVATEHDSVYAFDADGLSASPLWQANFLSAGVTTVSPADVASDAFLVEIGITGTPVVDPATGTLYVVALTAEGGHYVHRLHALDLATGQEKFGGPVVVTASSPGTDTTSQNGRVPFIPFRQLQRSALLLANNVVYVAFTSHADNEPYHGWVLAYDAQSLRQVAVYNDTPDGALGGIWMGAGGPAADASNNVYVSTGNGTFDGNTGGNDLGDSLVKLGTSGRAFTVADYFTPFDEASLEVTDYDLGAGGILLFSGSAGEPLLVGIGKSGKIYLVNRNAMGKYHAGNDSQIVQSFQSVASLYISMPAFWQNNLYIAPSNKSSGGPAQYRFANGTFSTTAFARVPTAFGFPGGVPTISSNGASNGIMWLVQADGWKTSQPAILHAYDANNISNELYNTSQAGARDTLGPAIKFSVPTIVNGKVYVGTGNALAILGSLGGPTTYQVSGTVSGAVASGVSFAATGGGSCTNSDGTGHYACTVPQGWSGTVTPSLNGYTFTPPTRSYVSVGADQAGQNYVASANSTTVWVEDAVPAGAVIAGDNESWTWIGSNPAPFSGTLAHQSALAAGIHQHYFSGATATLSVAAGDTLFAYVYLDPVNPPSEVMLQWNDGTWSHRAYWGANQIPWGTDGTVSRRFMGPLPATGQWVQLAVPAAQVGLGGSTLNGMAFALYNGRATWDYAGKSVGSPVTYQVSGTMSGAVASGVTFAATGGVTCSTSDSAGHYACTVPQGWSGTVTPALSGFTFVPSSRNYVSVAADQAGQDYVATAVSYQVSGTVSGAVASGVTFAATGGVSCSNSDAAGHYACTVPLGWTGTVTPALGGYAFAPTSRSYVNVGTNQPSQDYVATVATGGGVVWVDDAVPLGATATGNGEGWNWVSSNPAPFSGTLAHQSALAAGMHQHYFTGATSTIPVAAGNALFAYVYLDPANPPSEIMLQWNDGTWEHRAYWGANLIQWGTNGTVSRRYMGPLPPTGQWVRLSVPAVQVGLGGSTLNGMAFTLYDGRATWDYAGRYSVWVDDALPTGATATGTNESWTWISSNPTPYSGTLAHQSALAAGVHQHYFTGATATLAVGAGDTLFAYVYLDPANPPSEVMLQWNDGTWEHRAYWGANLIAWGTDGTVNRRYMGPLPATGQWVRLAVPAAQVGLAGSTVTGIAFTLYDGRATWDFAGK